MMMATYWKMSLEGSYHQGLTRWQLKTHDIELDSQGRPALTGPVSCNPLEWEAGVSQSVRLDAQHPSYTQTLCLPARLAELRPLKEGLSLLQGQDALTVQGVAMQSAWRLELAVQSCELGEASFATWSVRPSGKASPRPQASCDLRRGLSLNSAPVSTRPLSFK